MTKPIKGPPQVVQLFPKKAGHAVPSGRSEPLEQLIHGSLKLRKLEEAIGRPSFDLLVKIEGEKKSLFILHRFVQYYDDFASACDFFLYAMACGRYLSKLDPGGKYVETFPIRIDSQETRRERGKYFTATRRIGHYFHGLKLGAEQAKLFIEEVSPLVLPLFIGKSYNESLMLKERFIKDTVEKYGFDQFIEALRAAAKNKSVNLQTEVSLLIR